MSQQSAGERTLNSGVGDQASELGVATRSCVYLGESHQCSELQCSRQKMEIMITISKVPMNFDRNNVFKTPNRKPDIVNIFS
jgi:hypothetical protein